MDPVRKIFDAKVQKLCGRDPVEMWKVDAHRGSHITVFRSTVRRISHSQVVILAPDRGRTLLKFSTEHSRSISYQTDH